MPATNPAPEQLPMPIMIVLTRTRPGASTSVTVKVGESSRDQEVEDVPAITSAPELLPLPTLIILSGMGRTDLTNLASYLAASACRPAARRR
jgi:hypothetical protein